jgi:hypothetical protein
VEYCFSTDSVQLQHADVNLALGYAALDAGNLDAASRAAKRADMSAQLALKLVQRH